MRKPVLLGALLILAACLDQEPQPPSPEMQALMDACQDGDIDACATVERIRAENARAAAALFGQMQASRPQPQPVYQMPVPTNTRTTCNSLGGTLFCNSTTR